MLNILFVCEGSGVLQLSPVHIVPKYVGSRQSNESVGAACARRLCYTAAGIKTRGSREEFVGLVSEFCVELDPSH